MVVFLVFATFSILIFAIVIPRMPPVPYKFLSGKPCVEYGISPVFTGGSYEYAIYCWKEPYGEVMKLAQSELIALKFSGYPHPEETKFDGPDQTTITILAQEKLSEPPIWNSTIRERVDPAWVTVFVIRPAPQNIFTWVHVKIKDYFPSYR
jgi:hypothetical protein